MYALKRMDGSRTLITGGLGFIGSNIAHKLVSLGAEVTILDACLDPYGWNFANIKEIKNSVKFIKGDIRDAKTMGETVRNQDYIFNCAAQVSHVDSMKNPYLDIDINCRGNITLLEACRKYNDSVKIVYAGTRGQMGALKYSPADENHVDEPTDIYGVDKWAGEKYHLIYYKAYGIRTTSLRINNTYGERHQMKHGRYGILNWFIRLALEDKELTIFGEGKQKRDYNYVQDVVDAMILAAQKEESNGKYYLLGSGEPIAFIDMAKMIVKAVGKGRVVKVPWPKERKVIEVGDFFVTYERVREELGWEPRTKLEEGLRRTVEFYKNRLGEYI